MFRKGRVPGPTPRLRLRTECSDVARAPAPPFSKTTIPGPRAWSQSSKGSSPLGRVVPSGQDSGQADTRHMRAIVADSGARVVVVERLPRPVQKDETSTRGGSDAPGAFTLCRRAHRSPPTRRGEPFHGSTSRRSVGERSWAAFECRYRGMVYTLPRSGFGQLRATRYCRGRMGTSSRE